ncbi:MAG TPA: phosphatidylglycerophosphatase A [Terriglobales bacterium]|nr:phosphatidylglycerophosphatase A [Terriglobales bacterium]
MPVKGPSAENTTPTARPVSGKLAWLIATFFGCGRLRPGPGSWASAATVLLWWAISRAAGSEIQVLFAVLLACLAVTLGIPAATRVARESGITDPSFVVIDEVAGQLIALIAAPVRWKTLLAGFILFRAFDIVKPPPLRLLEKIPGGSGIMLDDVGAGLYALAILQAALHFGWLR